MVVAALVRHDLDRAAGHLHLAAHGDVAAGQQAGVVVLAELVRGHVDGALGADDEDLPAWASAPRSYSTLRARRAASSTTPSGDTGISWRWTSSSCRR